MKKRNVLTISSCLLILLTACNPDCESLIGINATIDSDFKTPGSEVLIQTQPLDLLQDHKVVLQHATAGSTELLTVESRFVENTGLIAKMPEGVTGAMSLLVEDPDCGGLIPLQQVNVMDQDFFRNHTQFITPTPPIIVIPTLTVPPPADPANAWFSPNNEEYCIWFAPKYIAILDDDGDTTETKLTSQLIPGDFSSFSPDNPSSLELSVNCVQPENEDLYHGNAVSGIIDTTNNVIRIEIDRSLHGLGIEEFDGRFLHRENLPESYIRGTLTICPAFDDHETPRNTFMLLTSRQTGKQLVLFQDNR